MLELVAIADMNVQGAVDRGMPRDLDRPRRVADVAKRDDIDVVVELLGGDEPARTLIANALNAGKPVVTANKHVLAHHGAELEAIARANNVALRYEACRLRRHAGARHDHPRPCRQPHPPRARHRQRQHQLHPDRDDAGRRARTRKCWPRPRPQGYVERDPQRRRGRPRRRQQAGSPDPALLRGVAADRLRSSPPRPRCAATASPGSPA